MPMMQSLRRCSRDITTWAQGRRRSAAVNGGSEADFVFGVVENPSSGVVSIACRCSPGVNVLARMDQTT
jgi:hypothetical protein